MPEEPLLQRKPSAPNLPMISPGTKEGVTRSALKLLLVEDNPGDARFLQEILKDARGVEIDFHHLEHLAPALEILKENSFDILLLDLSLPDGSGLETVTRTRAAAPHVPIIVLTGRNDEAFALRSVREGAQDYLFKGSIETDVLVRAIRYAIERHRLQLEHEEQQRQIEKLAAFVQLNPNPVLEFSPEGDLLYSNEAAGRMAESLGLKSPGEMILPETADIVRETLRTGEARQGIEAAIAERTISWSFFPIPRLKAVHSYALDITDRINLETRLRHSHKMEAVGQLAAGVAHDFNNFLTLIEGHLHLIRENDPPERLRHSLEQTGLAVKSAGNVIRQLLTFSRRQAIRRAPLDLNQKIAKLADLISQPLGKSISLKIEAEPELPTIHADGDMIEQMILNLAVNARDAMPGGGTLTIATSKNCLSPEEAGGKGELPPGPHVCILVSDTGVGMDPATLSRIFEPFFSTKSIGEGTGLGLATVYGIVNQHKGWIDVASQPGKGATFTIYLPAEKQ